MAEIWDTFVVEFCKVDFLCWHGVPNWLGWIVIAVLGLFALAVIMSILFAGR